MSIDITSLTTLTVDELRQLVLQQQQDHQILLAEKQQLQHSTQALLAEKQHLHAQKIELTQLNEKLTFELAVLRRLRFSKTSEQLHSGAQGQLFGEAIHEDIAAIETIIEQAALPQKSPSTPLNTQAKQTPLPEIDWGKFPQKTIMHEPDSTVCSCGCQLKRIGEEVSRKLDYTPGTFTVENHKRGKWVCLECETLTQAPMPVQLIDKGVATSGLLAHVLIAKFVDHLPLYRQTQIFARAGYPLARSTLAQWVGICGVHLQPLVDALRQHLLAQPVLHADETPVRMLSPGNGKTHQAYLWAYTSTAFSTLRGVIYDFTEGRAGRHAQQFLGQWQGTLVCDDYAGYKVLFQEGAIIESGCWAHARRKFFDVYQANKSELANYALAQIQQLYLTERDLQALNPEQRHQHRQTHMKPILDKLHQWMQEQSLLMPPKSAILKALMYSLNRWQALTRLVDDARLPMDNNAVENLMRPIALGRKNWLFAGSLRAGMRAAAIMSLLQSAKLNGLDVHAYLTDVLTRLPTHKASQIDELLPHNWQPSPT